MISVVISLTHKGVAALGAGERDDFRAEVLSFESISCDETPTMEGSNRHSGFMMFISRWKPEFSFEDNLTFWQVVCAGAMHEVDNGCNPLCFRDEYPV